MAVEKGDRDGEMMILKKVMDELRKLESGRARRRVMGYITERLSDEEMVEKGTAPTGGDA